MEESAKRKITDILPEIRWETIAPPYLNYGYFRGSGLYPFQYRADSYNEVNAWWLIEASTLAYSEEDFARERFAGAGLAEVTLFSGKSTQCYVANNDHFVIVAFRGTEIRPRTGRSDFQDIAADIKADSEIRLVPWGRGGKVHNGFQKALDEVWEDRKLFDYIRGRAGTRTLWFTGHSLGAALATLAADRCGNVQGVYTFGSPRVGDALFNSSFAVKAYRIVNHNDMVARVPPAGLYRHVGNFKYIDRKGRLRDNPGRWEMLQDGIQGWMASVFKSSGPMRSGFASLIPNGLIDHVPLLYATHLWNSLP